jgi:DNA-binding transcriptional LysR family regulator
MLDAHQLNVFLIAAETLNFTQAAERLHISQPSVSQHINTLERHFSTDLFIRAGRNIQLTDAGLSLVPLARELVKHSILIEETMASLKGEVFGHLLVGSSTTPGKYILPQLLARFHQTHPRVKVTCQVTSQTQAMQKLCDGNIHFALTSSELESCPEAEFRKFMCEQIYLIAPLNHPWANREEIDPDELYGADFIHREEESGTYFVVQEALHEIGIRMDNLRTLLTLGNSEAIVLSVQEGLGVGFVSNIVIEKLSQGKVVPIRIKGLNICRHIYIGHHTRRPATRAQNAFWDFVCNQSKPVTSPEDFNDIELTKVTT